MAAVAMAPLGVALRGLTPKVFAPLRADWLPPRRAGNTGLIWRWASVGEGLGRF